MTGGRTGYINRGAVGTDADTLSPAAQVGAATLDRDPMPYEQRKATGQQRGRHADDNNDEHQASHHTPPNTTHHVRRAVANVHVPPSTATLPGSKVPGQPSDGQTPVALSVARRRRAARCKSTC